MLSFNVLIQRNEMMRVCISLFWIIIPVFLLAQSSKNLELVSNIPIEETVNDVWGFQHSDGTEYAIMGDQNSTRIFSLADPTNPEQVADIVGTRSTWRDIKHFNDVVYVIADSGADGLLVVDMSQVDGDTISHSFLNLEVSYSSGFLDQMGNDSTIVDAVTRCHNLYINEEGFLYLAGCSIGNGGVIIFDLNEDPLLPKMVGIENEQYAHDVYVQDTLMFASEIFTGEMAIYSIADKTNPVLLGTINTPNNFTHNIWSSEDNRYAFTTDERSESGVGAYDISDPSNIKFLDKFKTIDGASAIPHNTHFHNNYLFTSWYTEGVVVTDVTRPENMIEVGHFDTFIGQSGGFNGCWGAFPFLPSGLLLASDRQSGLFVLQPTLVRAAYLEGTVTTEGTSELVNGAIVKINSEDKNEGRSNPDGTFKTGQCTAGTFEVTISHPDYFDLDTTVTLTSGEVTGLDIQLTKRQIFIFEASTEKENETALPDADLILMNDDHTFSFNSMEDGFITSEVLEGEYQVYAGKWGWKQVDAGILNLNDNESISLVFEPSYEDDFIFDFGWRVESSASAGEWQRDIPIPTTFRGNKSNVDFDIIDDLGESCYMTGNAGGQAGTDDVDNGATTLTSDWINLADFNEPYLEYYKWFYNDGGENIDPNDTLKTFILTQTDTVLVESISEFGISGEWTRSSIEIREFLSEDSIRVMYSVADDEEEGHILEAGIDVFRISEGTTISTKNLNLVNNFYVFPNPIKDLVTIGSEEFIGTANVRIYNVQGKLIQKDNLRTMEKTMNLSHLNPGIYFLNVTGESFKQTIKLIKS